MSKFLLFHEEGRPLLVNLSRVTTASPIAQGEKTRLHYGEGEGDGFSLLDESFDSVVLRLSGLVPVGTGGRWPTRSPATT